MKELKTDKLFNAVRLGKNGNKVYQILQNYQNEDSGGGYLRLLKFDLDKGSIAAEMYSPFYDKMKKDSSAFVINDVKFIKMSDFKK